MDPTEAQRDYFLRACGTARFAWNWALARWQQEYALWREYRCGPKPSEYSVRGELNSMKASEFPWMLDVSKNVPQQAIANLGRSFQNFFAGRTRYPQFKRKGAGRDSFRADNGISKQQLHAVEVRGNRIRLPRIGWIKMREGLRFVGAIKSATVSRTADRWFVSLVVDVVHTPSARESQAVGGCDLGVKTLATLSDGTSIEGPKALRKHLKALCRRNRALNRKVKGSANRSKARAKLARLHARISNIRNDALHKLTTNLVRRFDVIGIENLNVHGMMANGCLSRAVADVGMFEFRRQLVYKAAMHGVRVVVADRWYPSSKTCSDCGSIHAGLKLSDREWVCDACGVAHDRDHNAAINLMNLAARSAVTACGAERSGPSRKTRVKRSAVKQEPAVAKFSTAGDRDSVRG